MSLGRQGLEKEVFVVLLNPDDLSKLVRVIAGTREEELGCDKCFERLDRFAEMKLSGLNAAEVMPLVQDHLDKCRDCREEFEALRAAENAQDQAHEAPMFQRFGRIRAWLRRILGSP